MPAIRKHQNSSKVERKPYPGKSTSNNGRSKGYSNGAMRSIFAGCIMSLAGDFVTARNSPNCAYENIIKWIQGHGGFCSREVTPETTHLIVTIEEYKKKTAQVKKAIALGKRCKIVELDWIEDCLIGETGKKKKLATEGYSLSRVMKRLHYTDKQKKNYRNEFEDGVRAAEQFVDNKLHHVYTDPTGFEYKVVLNRITLNGKHTRQKYTVYLFESHAKPCTYMAAAKLSIPHMKNSYWKTECYPKIFAEAFVDFKIIFKQKTGVEWDDRLEPLPKGHGEQFFRFQRPRLGWPVGALPSWRKAPSWGEEEKTVDSCGESPNVSESESSEEENRGVVVQYTTVEESDYDSDSEVEIIDAPVTVAKKKKRQLPSPPSTPMVPKAPLVIEILDSSTESEGGD
ncbi:brct domain-containing protein [Rutstroemia sp. NJR-2017a WRK4]|nr:brct domain-containing protein [Rutstroemia sp. NJR-2017a WRK4]